jgi:enamine deaminase RidA (YjgF/YER057c/UK114 family)
VRILQPEGWPRPRGYASGVAAEGTMIFVSGQVGWDACGRFVSADFVPQVRQALANVVAVLAEAGARPEHIVRMTWYVTDKAAYVENRAEIGHAYRETIGRHFPAMSVVAVAALVEEQAKVEIEVTAVVPRPEHARDGTISSSGHEHADD